jgi:hypothetical protein
MPIRQRPRAGDPIKTRTFTPEGLDAEGEFREFFDLKDYLPPEVVKQARTEATKTTIQGKEKVEEVDGSLFYLGVVKAQLVGWRIMAPPDAPFDPATMFAESGQAWWKYLPANVDNLPEDVIVLLFNEIMAQGNLVPTRTLQTVGPDGRPVTFRRPDAELGGESVHDVSAALGDGVLPSPEPSPGTA